MYIGIIGKRYKDARLEDTVVQSELIAKGSADTALNGKI